MSEGELRCVHVSITGKVQGVWYRAWTNEEARDLGIDGWVRNRPDGSVEAVFRGDSAAVQAMLDLCWSGPPLSRVDGVEVRDSHDSVETGFVQRATG